MSQPPRAEAIGPDMLPTLLPHAGSMCLLESVTRWDAGEIVCRALSHRSPENPLRCGERLDALAAIEYAAQAIAIHGSLRAPGVARPQSGFLGRVSQVKLAAERLDDIEVPLAVSARHLAGSDAGCSYDFEVSAQGATLVTGRVLIAFGKS